MKPLPKLTLPNAPAWSHWLTENGTSSTGVLLTLAKKNTTSPTSLTRTEAVEEALCHGWIDGQSNTIDSATYSQRYTPRLPKSLWSKKNVGIVEHLEKQGRMQESGRAAVESAKQDGRRQRAYSGMANLEEMRDLMAAMEERPEALEAWEGMKKGEKAQVYFRLAALKTEAGRAKHIREYVGKLEREEVSVPKSVVSGTAAKSRKRSSLSREDDGEEPGVETPLPDAKKTRSGRQIRRPAS